MSIREKIEDVSWNVVHLECKASLLDEILATLSVPQNVPKLPEKLLEFRDRWIERRDQLDEAMRP